MGHGGDKCPHCDDAFMDGPHEPGCPYGDRNKIRKQLDTLYVRRQAMLDQIQASLRSTLLSLGLEKVRALEIKLEAEEQLALCQQRSIDAIIYQLARFAFEIVRSDRL